MITFYVVLVVILFLLAISALIVGVTNDAVNFLNSAIGAKAANFKVIMFVAALGIIAGATFSSGMMEVARKGIFHPEYFYFSEIMILFLAVMLADVILLDTFNTFGFPTSTTVSIVFELLGAAVAVALMKVITDPNSLELHQYINSSKALAIISGILVSVVIAFTAGVIIQYFSRLLFSFDYSRRLKYFGALWGGFAITAIIYFILVKGASGASFMTEQTLSFITDNSMMILLVCFVTSSVLLQLALIFFKLDILKVIILVGTFALAMAFAGNDLVNFIGVPLAGFNSYQIFVENGSMAANQFTMEGLAGQVSTPTFMLLIAGIIMVITLWTSKKARSVIQTSLDLGRQEEGYERFNSFLLSRSIVRNFSSLATSINNILPMKWRNFFDNQFDQRPFIRQQETYKNDPPSFDMVRGSVTLVVGSILIAMGTSLKLPLSTTYVTFMVFMGSSLADGAWGRESAVYRVSGVISVVGGWFITALSAFTFAFVLALAFYNFGITAIVLMILLGIYFLYRTHSYHKKRVDERHVGERIFEVETLSTQKVIDLSLKHMHDLFTAFNEVIEQSLGGLKKEDLKRLNKAVKNFKNLDKKVAILKNQINENLSKIPDDQIETLHLYILVVDHLKEMSTHVGEFIYDSFNHVDNHHKPLLEVQITELQQIHEILKSRQKEIIEVYRDQEPDLVLKYLPNFEKFLKKTYDTQKNQIKRIKRGEVGTKNSQLFLNHLRDFTSLGLHGQRLISELYDLLLLTEDKINRDTNNP